MSEKIRKVVWDTEGQSWMGTFPVVNLMGGAKEGSDTEIAIPIVTAEGKLLVEAAIDASDISIGAVEIKDATTDTRAVVGANGLSVDVKATVGLTDAELRATAVPVTESAPVWNRYTVPAVVEEDQDLTASWAALGDVIDVRGYTELYLYINLDINDSLNVRIRALGQMTVDGDGYVLPIEAVSSTEIKVTSQYIEFDVDADQKMILRVDVGAIPFVSIEVQAGTAGASPGAIVSAYQNKMWR